MANSEVQTPPRESRQSVRKLTNLLREQIALNEANTRRWGPEDFEYGKFLSSGTFGNVFLVRERSTRMVFGLKVIDKEQILDAKLKKQLTDELVLHKQLNHPNIIALHTYFRTDSHVYIVMDYAARGTVHELMVSQKDGRFEDRLAAKFVYQVSDALNYCHGLDIVHRDVKPENLLLDADLNVKLCDFGWACLLRGKKSKRICGTDEYFPPEMVEHKFYGKSVDVWNVGVLCYEFLAGVTPFHSEDKDTLYKNIVNTEIKYPKHFSPSAIHLISNILVYHRLRRLRLEAIMNHEWVKEHYAL